jgi:hypothetical protein
MLFTPREHGAYGQLALPLLTSFAVAGVTTTAVLLAVAVVSCFLAHEPLLVLLGRRGARAKRENGSRAVRWFALTMVTAAAAGVGVLWVMPPAVRWSLVLPIAPALIVAAAIAAGREKGAAAEIAVALAFSAVALPLCLVAGAPATIAAAVAIAFGVVFVVGTLAVRSVILAAHSRTVAAAGSTRVAVLLLVGAAGGTLAASATRALLPWAALAAVAPGLAVAAWLVLFPPVPTRLRGVGWTLVAATTATALILVSGLPAR